MISVICVYNDARKFESCLARSLKRQSAAHELIGLDNTAGAFRSAAAALNEGGRRARPDSQWLVFAHQDVELGSASFLEQAVAMMEALPGAAVAGVAGRSQGSDVGISNITHGPQRQLAAVPVDGPTAVMTVDECLALVPREVFAQLQFDEDVCSGWHAYVVEYCLRALAAGRGVYVLPLSLYHASPGTLGRQYFRAMGRVLAQHAASHEKIYTMCGCWDAAMPAWRQWLGFVAKKNFYGCTSRLIAAGLVPRWLQRKKNRRLNNSGHNPEQKR